MDMIMVVMAFLFGVGIGAIIGMEIAFRTAEEVIKESRRRW
jgi:gas vesicle protein